MTFFIKSPKSVTVVVNGKTFTAPSDHSRYNEIIEALSNDDDERLEQLISTPIVPEALASFGMVQVYRSHVTLNGEPVHSYLTEKILATQDHEPLIRFLDNVSQNPSRRAAQDLYSWCEKAKLPITEDGEIIAYKYVREDYKDVHSGTMDNSVGKVVEVLRSQVDDDFRVSCSHGLHFCSWGYLSHMSGVRLMLVKVNPRDVVAFPDQYEFTKARCCRYEVVEEIDWSQAATYFDDVTGYYVPPRPLEAGEYAVHIDDPSIHGEVGAYNYHYVYINDVLHPRNKLKRATPPEPVTAPAVKELRFVIRDEDGDYVQFCYGDYYYNDVEDLTYTFEEALKHRASHSRWKDLVIRPAWGIENPQVALNGSPTTLEGALDVVNGLSCTRYDTWTLIPIVVDQPRFNIVDQDGHYLNFAHNTWWHVAQLEKILSYTFEEALEHLNRHSRPFDLEVVVVNPDDLNRQALLNGSPTTLLQAMDAVNGTSDKTGWKLSFDVDPAVTILARIEAIEKALGVWPRGTIENRLDAIDRELGLEVIQPLVARIARAEAQLGL